MNIHGVHVISGIFWCLIFDDQREKLGIVFGDLARDEWFCDDWAFYRLTHVLVGPIPCCHVGLDL